jgi:hydrogenase nickel incorporation protein HypB
MEITVLRNVFEQNDNAARDNRTLFDAHGVTCINLLGGAGCGKTSILEAVLPRLAGSLRIAVLEGDLATTKDAARIAALGVPVVQLLTDGGCHLNATLVEHALAQVSLDELDMLIVENVGNPICPANFDLGEHARISVLSVTEGTDKPAKYPLLFRNVDAVLLAKCDLLPHTDFDIEEAEREITRLNPRAKLIRTAIKGETGVEELAGWLRCKSNGERAAAARTA